jgi:2Fe-2S ferredoxin
MPTIIYIQGDGGERSIEVEVGANIMRTAIANNVRGIIAECGGAAMCATCHVYVDPDHAGLLPPREGVEEEMLESVAADRQENSRLSCQLHIPPGVDVVRVYVPVTQR